jgi:hypothetical protein
MQKILMDERFDKEDDYGEGYEVLGEEFKICKSEEGFVVGHIIQAIFNFLIEKIPHFYRDNLALTGFRFDR